MGWLCSKEKSNYKGLVAIKKGFFIKEKRIYEDKINLNFNY